jgi:hypothetical protein
MRKILIAGLVVTVFAGGAALALYAFWPQALFIDKKPALASLPDLPPVTRTSTIVAPVAIANNSIRDMLEVRAPRDLAGKRDNPLSELLGRAEIGWTMARGPILVAGRPEGLTITTTVNGTLRAMGQIANQGGALPGAIAGIFGGQLGRDVQNLATRVLDQRADIRGNVTMTAKPQLLPTWRIEPHLSGQAALADGGMSVAGIRLNVSNEVKPMLDSQVNEQIAALSNMIRNDPTLEQHARVEWQKMCRSIPLGAATAGSGAPNLWLELRPTRALAGHPRMHPEWVILTVGVQAETRIVPNETKPTCPFPAQLDIVPQMDQGKFALAVPIDLPFTELNRLLEQQLKGKTFQDPNARAEVTVQSISLAASRDRLLVSMRVKAREKKSWFGFAADATVHIWGKPTLDRTNQILRLTDIELDVNSETAFGLLGAGVRAAIPYLQSALAEQAVIDLKPFTAQARTSIEAAIGDLQKQADGVKAETSVAAINLVGIEYDSKTLRVVAEADGTVRALVTKLE